MPVWDALISQVIINFSYYLQVSHVSLTYFIQHLSFIYSTLSKKLNKLFSNGHLGLSWNSKLDRH